MRTWTQINSESQSSLVRPYDLESPELDIFVWFETISPDSQRVRNRLSLDSESTTLLTGEPKMRIQRTPKYLKLCMFVFGRFLAHGGVAQAFGKGSSASPRRTIDGSAPPAHRTHDFLNPLLRIQLRQDRYC